MSDVVHPEIREIREIVKGSVSQRVCVCVGGCDVYWQHNLQQVGVCNTVTVQNQF